MDPRTFNVLDHYRLGSGGAPVQKGVSPLMQAKGAPGAHLVNACPFGCEDDDLDDNGYCKHLVGFTNSTPQEVKDGKGVYEPMVENSRGARQVMVPMVKKGNREVPNLPALPPGAQLVQITTSYRVYLDQQPERKQKAS